MKLLGRYLTVGPPGTGKTTWLAAQVEACSCYGQRVLVCSLTRAAKAEIVGRGLMVPAEAVGTLHGHAYAAIGRPTMIQAKDVAAWNERYPVLRLGGTQADADDPFVASRETDGDKLLNAWNLARHRLLIPRGTPRYAADHESKAQPLRKVREAGESAGIGVLSGAQGGVHEGLAPNESTNGRATKAQRDIQEGVEASQAISPDLRNFGVKWETWKAETGLIDFADQIELAIDAPAPEIDVILVDEAQDLSALEWRLVESWAETAEALVMVGDAWQALYTWRGADPSCLAQPSGFAGHKVLGQSYRLSPAVYSVAVKWVSMRLSSYGPVEYRPTDRWGDGEVRPIEASCRFPEPAVDEAERFADAGESTVFLASCAYMLAPTITVLRQRGLPFSNPWRTHRGAWNPLSPSRDGVGAASRLLSFLSAYDFESEDGHTVGRLAHWTTACPVAGLMQKGGHPRIEKAAEENPGDAAEHYVRTLFLPERMENVWRILRGEMPLAEAIAWFCSFVHAKYAKATDYAARVLSLRGFAALREPPRIHVGTIHSLKGGEADNVVLYPDLSLAAQQEWDGRPEQRDNVVRTFYVGLTRARKRVLLAQQAGPFAVEIRI